MRLVASTPNSKPVPKAIRSSLAAISQDDLPEVVERISVPRPTGTLVKPPPMAVVVASTKGSNRRLDPFGHDHRQTV